QVVVTASDTSIGKPDPAPYLLAADRLGVDPARCLVVEDAPAGLTAARAAGCATLAVTTTHEAAELDADAVVGTLADVRFTVGDDGVRVRARG
ncbi:MAG TPA: HAD-IA family hydrolase, partial [Kineosporiaceae bacterium]|nr:HAD-IA family hydrolase [Kineosporiaceae bacterium]